MRFEIHSKSGCPFCTYAKKLIERLGYRYEEFLYDDNDARQAMYDRFNLVSPDRTVPQIFAVDAEGNRTYIGSYSNLLMKDYPQANTTGMFDADF